MPSRISMLLFGISVTVTMVAVPARAADAEIDALLSRVAASTCEFNRNGTWYRAAEARSHLARKLNYLELLGRKPSAEQFIDLAASKSSVSGEPYLVKCGSGPAVQSAPWLKAQLQAVRSGASQHPLSERVQ